MIAREHNSRFLRMRSRSASHARYTVLPDRAEDYRPDHSSFADLADTVAADDIPLDLGAHSPEGEV